MRFNAPSMSTTLVVLDVACLLHLGRQCLVDHARCAWPIERRKERAVQRRDVVVIGASAGGVQALLEVVRGLPSDFPGAICVVVHGPPRESMLPTVLARAGVLPASHARPGEPIVPGHIFVAPPDYHLLVRPGWLELSHGPRENHCRPAVDPLFRSAARAFGQRVVGVVLSGALGDGAAGLFAVKARGGVAIVQDPADALSESMPRTALEMVEVDHVLPARAIAEQLVDLVGRPPTDEGAMEMDDEFEQTVDSISEDFVEQASDQRGGELTLFSCPECGGSLWQSSAGSTLAFQCHVGHTYQGETLLNQKSEQVEAALWASMRLLKERATLTRQVAGRLRKSGEGQRAARIEEQAVQDDGHVRSLRELLESNSDPLAAPFVGFSESGGRRSD
jgi:two-component system chemotaxis response regulator CheB